MDDELIHKILHLVQQQTISCQQQIQRFLETDNWQDHFQLSYLLEIRIERSLEYGENCGDECSEYFLIYT